MSAYILPNVILFVAVTCLLVLLGRHIPEARNELAKGETSGVATRLGFWFLLKGYARSAWRFVLEAKGIHSPMGSKLRMKQLLTENRRVLRKTVTSAKSVVTKSVGKITSKPRPVAAKISSAQMVVSPRQADPFVSVNAEISVPSSKPDSAYVPETKVITDGDTMVLVKQLLDNRKFFEARKMLENMGSSMEHSSLFWARLGYAQYHLAGYAEAVKSYEKSIALDSTQPNRYYNLSLAYEGLGNTVKALSNLDMALKLDPGNAKYLETKKGLVGR